MADDMSESESFKRRRARRSVLTALLLAVVAVMVYAGFIWQVEHEARVAKAHPSQPAASASSTDKTGQFEIY